MQVCNYCGRNLKKHYEICPGCGSNSFTEKIDPGDYYIIETPPTGGYKLDIESVKGQAKFAKFFKYFGIAFLVIEAFAVIPFLGVPFLSSKLGMSDSTFNIAWIGSILIFIPCFSIVPIIFIIIGSNMQKRSKKEIERIETLAKTGTLIKNIPYQTVNTGYSINERQIMAIQIAYKTPDGKVLNLKSNPKFDNKVFDPDGKADLLIDPRDYTNYYIDIEII